MTDRTSAWNRIAQYSFLRVFANDATIDAEELAFMQKLALEDGVVDEREREVLSAIFARVTEQTVAPDVWAEICAFKAEHAIP